ncbi:hypothetical protein CsSME_00009992 [Camellia sinensis var. sinensis]
MDYDTDEKSMAALRRQLKRAREEYYRYKSEYMNFVMETLELEDTVKNYDRRDATGCATFLMLKLLPDFPDDFKIDYSRYLGSIIHNNLREMLKIVMTCSMSSAIPMIVMGKRWKRKN